LYLPSHLLHSVLRLETSVLRCITGTAAPRARCVNAAAAASATTTAHNQTLTRLKTTALKFVCIHCTVEHAACMHYSDCPSLLTRTQCRHHCCCCDTLLQLLPVLQCCNSAATMLQAAAAAASSRECTLWCNWRVTIEFCNEGSHQCLQGVHLTPWQHLKLQCKEDEVLLLYSSISSTVVQCSVVRCTGAVSVQHVVRQTVSEQSH
jgi:hypothetical protein